jgi:hypothetical protein
MSLNIEVNPVCKRDSISGMAGIDASRHGSLPVYELSRAVLHWLSRRHRRSG